MFAPGNHGTTVDRSRSAVATLNALPGWITFSVRRTPVNCNIIMCEASWWKLSFFNTSHNFCFGVFNVTIQSGEGYDHAGHLTSIKRAFRTNLDAKKILEIFVN